MIFKGDLSGLKKALHLPSLTALRHTVMAQALPYLLIINNFNILNLEKGGGKINGNTETQTQHRGKKYLRYHNIHKQSLGKN